ncbi:tRNA (adenosine(37)-N6)-threonylcarbamoyltransferase complex ATPase subunit type 1 TsaE [Candidatus Kaiserbacteria bacterium]|nr:tRNA (adenosine(37)-N6)-threonylcarbamoyltransferase complex ATPase subunit type 1 TsaE [Candidatus Kaiserbacteria bacterium]
MQKVLLAQLPEFVRNVTATLALDRNNTKAVVLGLRGELGAGKTTFVQQLARQFGIRETLQSPTYVLMKKYAMPEGLNAFGVPRRFKWLVHIDAYRLEKPEEFAALKPEQFLNDPSVLVVVEWPERLGKALPTPDLNILFSSDGAAEGERYVQMEK